MDTTVQRQNEVNRLCKEFVQPTDAKHAIEIQKQLAGMVRMTPLDKPVRYIVGIDSAYIGEPRNYSHIVTAAVLYDLQTKSLIETSKVRAKLTFPYIPGLLSFREAPSAIEAVRTRSNVKPVYVSVGNKMTLREAVEIIFSSSQRYRLPEPSRLAHNSVSRFARE
jgi:deoxyinosine 3'endonuclease (endonuclease V)